LARLLRSDEPTSFHGQFYQLQDALVLPRPQRAGGPPILIGGIGPKRTLPLVARYADIWNALMVTPDEFRALSAQLDDLLRAEDRPLDAVRRTLMINLTFAADRERLVSTLKLADTPDDAALQQAVANMRASHKNIVGTPEMALEQIAT